MTEAMVKEICDTVVAVVSLATIAILAWIYSK
jgi:hypothetical protein